MAKGETYLGDAVYASFDGWYVTLRTGDANNQVIHLESRVQIALVQYFEDLVKTNNKRG